MRLGLAGWSLCRRFDNKGLTLLDYPDVVKNEFGLDLCELNSPYFASTDEDYLEELRRRLSSAGVQAVHISVDAPGDLSSLDEALRAETVEGHRKWFGVCTALGCTSFRANTGHVQDPTDAHIAACVKSFAALAQQGEQCGVSICIENHGGLSYNPDSVVRVMDGVGSKYLRTCPDFGNFPDEIRYAALEKIMPYAAVVHAKFFEFDSQGEDTKIDAKRCASIIKGAGFDGTLLIEFEGSGDDHDGVAKSIDLLRRYLG